MPACKRARRCVAARDLEGTTSSAASLSSAGVAAVVLGYLPAMTDPIVDPEQPQTDEPQIPTEPAPPIGSRFLFVDVAALRAKQLKRGARVRLGDDVPAVPHKAERLAMEEVRRGLVYYDIPLPKSSRPEGEA